MDAAGEVEAVGDWAAQYDLSHRAIQSALERIGASLDDVICRRIFPVDGVEPNRPYGEGPARFANSCPVSMGYRVSGLVHPDLPMEVEAVAMKGAGANIEWMEPGDEDVSHQLIRYQSSQPNS